MFVASTTCPSVSTCYEDLDNRYLKRNLAVVKYNLCRKISKARVSDVFEYRSSSDEGDVSEHEPSSDTETQEEESSPIDVIVASEAPCVPSREEFSRVTEKNCQQPNGPTPSSPIQIS